MEECRDAAKQRSREEWQRRTLNEDMLSEDIIVEIQEDCSASSRCSSSDEDEKELAEKPMIEIKSCLKKPPVVVATTPASKKNNGKKNQKKRKRSHSKSSSHVDGNTKEKTVCFRMNIHTLSFYLFIYCSE